MSYFVLFCVLYRKESANKRYRNTVNSLISPNTVSQNDEKPHTADLDDTAIPHVKIKIKMILFADDINVFLSHKDKGCLTKILNDALNRLSIWFKVNRLALNLKKKNIAFKPCQKRTNQTIQLLTNGQKTDQVKKKHFSWE